MTRRRLAHSYMDEVRPVRHAEPAHPESPWAFLAQILAAAIVTTVFVWLALVLLLAGAQY